MSSPLDDFLEAYWRDRDGGRVRPLADYLVDVPDDEQATIAAEFVALESDPQSTVTAADGEHCGPYRLLRALGRGGQGEVWLAEDTRLGRHVALKILTNVGLVSEAVAARFRREAEIASRIDHPGISTVFEAGAHEGTLYIAMRYIEGRTLRELIADETEAEPTSDSDRERVAHVIALIERVARAAHAAHELGIVHRDLKPANIIVTDADEPIILDFGLARDLADTEHALTVTGDLFGTPAYMAPEQLGPRRVPLDARVDVFALGVTLYECLTLRRPFDGASRDALFDATLHAKPTDPQTLNPAVPNDLATVLEVALEKDRDHRYRTALDLATDLANVREHRPIRARPAGPLQRFRRWVQRNPGLATLWFVLVAALVVSLWLLRENANALDATRRERDRNRGFQRVLLAGQSVERDPYVSLAIARDAARAGLESVAIDAMHRGLTNLRETRFFAFGAPVRSVSFDATGDRLAVTGDETTRVWPLDGTGEPTTHPGRLAFAGDALVGADAPDVPDGVTIEDDVITVAGGTDVERGAGMIHAVRVSPDRGLVAIASENGARLAETERGETVLTLHGHRGAVRAIAFHPDGRRVATGGDDGTARIWSIAPAAFGPLALDVGPTEPTGAVLAPDGRTLALPGDRRRPPRLVDTTDGAQIATLPHDAGRRAFVGFSSDGTHAIVVERDGRAVVYDRRGVHRRTIRSPRRPIAIDVDRDGERAITGDAGGRVIVWDLAGARSLHAGAAHRGPVGVVRVSPDAARAVSAGDDGTAVLWDLARGETVRRIEVASSAIGSIAFDATGARFMTIATDGAVDVFATADGRAITRVTGEPGTDARFAPADRLVVVGPNGRGTIRTVGRDDARPFDVGARVEAVVGIGGGRLVVRADDTVVLHRLDGAAPGRVTRLRHGAPIVGGTLMPTDDGSRIVVFGEDGRLDRWALDPIAAADARLHRPLTARERADYGLDDARQ